MLRGPQAHELLRELSGSAAAALASLVAGEAAQLQEARRPLRRPGGAAGGAAREVLVAQEEGGLAGRPPLEASEAKREPRGPPASHEVETRRAHEPRRAWAWGGPFSI